MKFMHNYVTHNIGVSAVQNTFRNREYGMLKYLVDDGAAYPLGNGELSFNITPEEKHEAQLGDWIVVDNDNNIKIYTPPQFEQLYMNIERVATLKTGYTDKYGSQIYSGSVLTDGFLEGKVDLQSDIDKFIVRGDFIGRHLLELDLNTLWVLNNGCSVGYTEV